MSLGIYILWKIIGKLFKEMRKIVELHFLASKICVSKLSNLILFSRYLKSNPENLQRYPKLQKLSIDSIGPECEDKGFETMAELYLKVIFLCFI